uniref:Uncharacterized protein n=1 Tax=Oryza meridionalis TaxID=40149 RepID=A0A0E0ERX8_9ORYZ
MARWIQPSSGRGSPDPAASNLIAIDQRLQFHHVHIVIISDADTVAATEVEIQSMKTVIVVAPTANTMGTPGAWWNREASALPPSPSCMATESDLLRSRLTGSIGMDYKCYIISIGAGSETCIFTDRQRYHAKLVLIRKPMLACIGLDKLNYSSFSR